MRCLAAARHPRQQPRGDLPIAAHPTMPPSDIAGVARRMFFVQHHIAKQAGTAVGALDQIVAENRVLGKIGAAAFEGIDIVNSLADE